MIILSLYYTHKPGGYCKRLYRLLNALSRQGEAVHYLSLDPPPVDLSNKIHWHRIPFPFKSRAGAFFWLAFTALCPLYAASAALKLKPDRYCVFSTYYAAILGLARSLRPAPLVLFVRTRLRREKTLDLKPSLKDLLIHLGDLIGLSLASRIICQTEAVKRQIEFLLGSQKKETALLPNDLPPTLSKASNTSSSIPPEIQGIIARHPGPIMLAAGPLTIRKNLCLLLKALRELKHRRHVPMPFLLIAGSGPAFLDLQESAQRFGLCNVKFLGWIDYLEALYPHTTLFLHPSLWEGMPNAVLEALAASVPVLASDIPEHRELLVYEELLFDPKDPLSLAVKLEDLSPTALKRWEALCAERAKALTFDWEVKASELVCRPQPKQKKLSNNTYKHKSIALKHK